MKEVGHPGPGDCDEPGRPTKGQIVGVPTPSRSLASARPDADGQATPASEALSPQLCIRWEDVE